MPPDDASALGRVHMLKDLPSEEIQRVARQCAWRRYRAQECIVSSQSKDRHVHFIVSGKVRVAVYSLAGKVVSFRDLPAGGTFGEISAIDGLPRSANVEALEECTIASLPPRMFWELMERNASIMAHVARLLSGMVRSLSERLFELSTLGIQNRVHAEVLRLAKEASLTRNRAVIDPAPRHADIASRISANREQVTKELSAMARQGLVAKEGRTLVVPDVARLERMVTEVLRTA